MTSSPARIGLAGPAAPGPARGPRPRLPSPAAAAAARDRRPYPAVDLVVNRVDPGRPDRDERLARAGLRGPDRRSPARRVRRTRSRLRRPCQPEPPFATALIPDHSLRRAREPMTRSARQARMERRDNPDRIDSALPAEPTENADATEPTDPIDRMEPADPIERMAQAGRANGQNRAARPDTQDRASRTCACRRRAGRC